MAVRFFLQEFLPAPPDRVFRALTDLAAAAHWMPDLVRIEPLDPLPLREGSRWRETRRMGEREATEQFEVTRLTPPRELRLRVDGTLGSSRRGEYHFHYRLQPLGAGTELELRGEIRGLEGMLEIVGMLVGGPYRSACANDLRALGGYLAGAGSGEQPPLPLA